jgi:hypothetical protein
MSSDTLSKPNTRQRTFSGPYANPSLFYTNLISIFFSRIQLKISQGWDYTLATPLHKRTRLMHYKYTMNHSSQMFIISLFLIFSEFISLKYHHTFSLYKVTAFTIKESMSIKMDFLQASSTTITTTSHLRLPSITITNHLGFPCQAVKHFS